MADKLLSIFLIIFIICIQANDEVTENSTEFDLLCDENSTCSSFSTEPNENVTDDYFTTEIYTNETINVTSTTENPKVKEPHINYDKQSNKDTDSCLCDLQVDYCDINCCCDKNCTNQQKSMFSDCGSPPHFEDAHYCYTVKTKYVNKTKIYEEEPEHRLFCVIRSNLPAHHIVQLNKPIESVKKVDDLISKRYKWPYILESKHLEKIEPQSLEHKYGSTIWIQISDEEFVPLMLPDKFTSSVCAQKKPIRFLEDFTSTCSQTFIDESNNAVNLETYYKNISVFMLPKNFSLIETYTLECGKNNCISINVFLCNSPLTECEILQNYTDIKTLCHFSPFRNEYSCLNLVQKVRYIFFHNISSELTKINLYMFLSNVTYFLDENFEFIQSFEVKFFWDNYKQNFSSILSGNPGYLLGKYILFGELITNKINNTSNKYKISKNDNDITKNILVFPKNDKGLCFLNNESYFPVHFGYNIQSNCIYQHKINISENTTTQCVNLQKDIFRMWQINISRNSGESGKYVGMFGNANRLKIAEWIEILYKFNDAKILKEIVGEYKNNKIICRNIAHVLKINFIYADVDFEHSKKQSKLLNVIYELQITEYFSTKLFLDNDIQLINIDLGIQIVFFDVTKPTGTEYAKPPNFHISLPHDFFYPFMIGSQVTNNINFKLIIYMIGILTACN